MKKIFLIALVLCLAAFYVPASSADTTTRNVILATTTSTQDTGLLDVLIPIFEKADRLPGQDHRCRFRAGTAMGRKGEADALLVHLAADEKKIIAEGFGLNRRLVMHNDFIYCGACERPSRNKKFEIGRRDIPQNRIQRSVIHVEGR